jgi:hypothetical protein
MDVEAKRSAIAKSLELSPAATNFELVRGETGWQVRERETGKIVADSNK